MTVLTRSRRRKLRSLLRRGVRVFRADEKGAIAVIFALSLGAVAGTLALSYELGKAWTVQSELQAAADAAALAGATQLDQTAGSRDRARQLAQSEFVRNQQTFADDGAGADVLIPTVTFYETIDPDVVAADDETAQFIEVTTAQRSVGFVFSLLTGGPSGADPVGRAVAGSKAAYCKVPPMFMCLPSGASSINDLTPGRGVWMKDSGSSLAPGNFGLLALENATGTTLSAAVITDALARENPFQQCYSADTTLQTKPGQTTSVRAGLNMRFDIYPNNYNTPEGTDVLSNPQYRPSRNTVKGLWKDGAGSQCRLVSGGSPGWKLPVNRFTDPSQAPADIDHMHYPRDDCAYPDSNTCGPDSGNQVGDGVWRADTYLAVNHPAATESVSDVNDWVNANGANYGSTGELSRFEMHQWEVANGIPDFFGGERADTINGSAAPYCHSGATPDAPLDDRRVLTIAVLDCGALSGTTEIEPEGYVNIFLTEPIGVFNANSLYAEIIGPTTAPDLQAEVARRVIQLYR